ncbi:MAG: arginase family protein [Nocardioidaceae bacterium]
MTPGGWYLLGAPWDCAGSDRGEARAPDALRAAGLAELVGADLGDADCVIDNLERDDATGVRALPETVRAARNLADALAAAVPDRAGGRPLVVGGDCSILLGIYPALRSLVGTVGLWFVDGHPDYLDGSLSETGETADMELAILTGDGAEPLTTLAGDPPMLGTRDVVLLGHRTQSLDATAAAEVARLPADLRRIDAGAVADDPRGAARRGLDWLDRCDHAWLHLDVDVLDSAALPAVSYPGTGGPDWAQLEALLEPFAHSSRLLGVSVADFRPDLDPAGEYASRLVRMLARTLP